MNKHMINRGSYTVGMHIVAALTMVVLFIALPLEVVRSANDGIARSDEKTYELAFLPFPNLGDRDSGGDNDAEEDEPEEDLERIALMEELIQVLELYISLLTEQLERQR